MKILSRKLAFVLAIGALLGAGSTLQADPVGDFFKRLGRSISNNGKKQPTRRTSAQKTDSKQSDAQKESGGNDEAGPDPTPPKQSGPSVRMASAVSDPKNSKRDAPFGIPVPGKKGFVTSPYSPDGNYVDVRAFPPGAEVKDPYTGRIFRVP